MQELKTIYAQAARWALPFLALILIISVYTCNESRGHNADMAKEIEDARARTVQIENEKGKLISQNETLLHFTNKELQTYTDTIFNLRAREARLIKSVTSYAQIVQEAKFKGKTAKYKDPAPRTDQDPGAVVTSQPADTNFIRVPRGFIYSDSTLSFDGVVRRDGVTIDSLTIPNTLHIRTAIQKSGFLKLGSKTVVQAFNTNPAFKNTGIVSAEVKNRGTWWQRWGKPAVAIIGTVIIYRQIKK